MSTEVADQSQGPGEAPQLPMEEAADEIEMVSGDR